MNKESSKSDYLWLYKYYKWWSYSTPWNNNVVDVEDKCQIANLRHSNIVKSEIVMRFNFCAISDSYWQNMYVWVWVQVIHLCWNFTFKPECENHKNFITPKVAYFTVNMNISMYFRCNSMDQWEDNQVGGGYWTARLRQQSHRVRPARGADRPRRELWQQPHGSCSSDSHTKHTGS